jgi:hypothetical protein
LRRCSTSPRVGRIADDDDVAIDEDDGHETPPEVEPGD